MYKLRNDRTHTVIQSRRYRWVEFCIIFIILPLLYWRDWVFVPKVLPLIMLAAYCCFVLIVSGRMRFVSLTAEGNWKKILGRFLILTGLLSLVLLLTQVPVFQLTTSVNNWLWTILLYPLVSVFPQELLFREFFFHRYRSIMSNDKILILLNVVLFSLAHAYYSSWIVFLFTLIGGLLFAHTFQRTRSLMTVTIEHSLYGLFILATGIGGHFYKAF